MSICFVNSKVLSMSQTHFLGQVTQKALIERDGKFLFIQYPKDKPHVSGFWDMPGGRLNDGEQPLDGLRREVREEIGAEIVIGNILATGIFTNMSNKKNFLVLYSATLLDPGATLTFQKEEAEGAEWFTKEQTLELPIYYAEHKEIVRKLLMSERLD